MTDRARWLRRWAAATTLGFGALALPIIWWAITKAYLSGNWRLVLDFGAFSEGPTEILLLTIAIPISWLGLVGMHELLRQSGGGRDA